MTSRRRRDRQPAGLLAAGRRAGRRVDRRLPRPGERVAVVGCGTSWFMAQAYAALREAGRPRRDRRVPGLRVPGRPARTTGSSRSPAPAPPPRSSTCSTRCAAARRPRCIIGDPAPPAAGAGRPTRSRCRSPTSSRWCRPASPPARWPCCGPTSARTSTALAADAEVAVRAAAAGRPGRPSSRSPSWAAAGPSAWPQEAALKCREAADVLGRGVPGDGLPARPDRDRRARPGGVGVRRGPATCRRRGGDRRSVRARRTTAARLRRRGRPPLDPMADLILAQRFAVALADAPGPGPGRAPQPDPLGRPAVTRPSSSPSTSAAPGMKCALVDAGRHGCATPSGTRPAAERGPDAVVDTILRRRRRAWPTRRAPTG